MQLAALVMSAGEHAPNENGVNHSQGSGRFCQDTRETSFGRGLSRQLYSRGPKSGCFWSGGTHDSAVLTPYKSPKRHFACSVWKLNSIHPKTSWSFRQQKSNIKPNTKKRSAKIWVVCVCSTSFHQVFRIIFHIRHEAHGLKAHQ